MQTDARKHVRYFLNAARMSDGLVALDDIPTWGFINCHHGVDGEIPSHQEPIVDRAYRQGVSRFHDSFRSLRDRAQGVTYSEDSCDEVG